MPRIPLGWILPVVLLANAPVAVAHDIPAPALDSLAGRGTLLFRLDDGRFEQGKVTEATADSLYLGKGQPRKAIARADVEQVWHRKKTVLESALVGAGLGAVGGAFLELGLGSCDECGSRTGDVLEAAAVGAGVRAAEGALIGLFGGHWKPEQPPASELPTDRRSPWHPWSVSARIGSVGHIDPDYGDLFFDDVGGGFAGWKNTRPGSSWGFEYALLEQSTEDLSHKVLLPPFTQENPGPDTLQARNDSHYSDRWAFSSLSFRTRTTSPGMGCFVTFGLGSYIFRTSVKSGLVDSLGAVLAESSGKSTTAWFGSNLGGGMMFGHGDWRPAIEARVH